LDSKEKTVMLEDYAARPLPSTVLVLCFQGSFDMQNHYLKCSRKTVFWFSVRKCMTISFLIG
jgi:DNA polymerase-3 subunit delta